MPAVSPPISIEQGPPWLVDLYFSPPSWLNPSIKLLAAVAFAIVFYRLYQRGWHVDMETQRDMQIITATIVAVVSATLAMVNLTAQPYLVDVGVGFALGYGVVLVPQHPSIASWWSDTVGDPRQRRAYVWFVLAVAALALPQLVAVNGMGVMLTSSRMSLTALSASIGFYDAMLMENHPARQAAEA